jgi:hypothetical protein
LSANWWCGSKRSPDTQKARQCLGSKPSWSLTANRGGPSNYCCFGAAAGLLAGAVVAPGVAREFNMALNMVAKDRPAVDTKVWTHERTELIRAAAQDPIVTYILNPAIKKAICREAGADRSWLSKVRPWWGHDEHFHVRIVCPSDSLQCKPQLPAASGDGCGHELDSWLKESIVRLPSAGAKPKHNFTLAAMPKEKQGAVSSTVPVATPRQLLARWRNRSKRQLHRSVSQAARHRHRFCNRRSSAHTLSVC